MTSIDVRFWPLKTVPALKRLIQLEVDLRETRARTLIWPCLGKIEMCDLIHNLTPWYYINFRIVKCTTQPQVQRRLHHIPWLDTLNQSQRHYRWREISKHWKYGGQALNQHRISFSCFFGYVWYHIIIRYVYLVNNPSLAEIHVLSCAILLKNKHTMSAIHTYLDVRIWCLRTTPALKELKMYNGHRPIYITGIQIKQKKL